MAKVLVIEDDQSIADMINDWLLDERFAVEVATSLSDAREFLHQFEYDAIVLDWTLPDGTGIEILQELRQRGDVTPVIMLTGKNQIEDKVEGLDSGADDYLTKPFHMKELTSRLKAVLRRPANVSTTLTVGHVSLDSTNYKVTINGAPVSFHSREFALLEYLLRHPGQVFSAEALLDRVWTSETAVGPETVRQCVKRLRKKIDLDDAESMIENIYGVGYRLKDR
ncbi:MAG: response regulator transcription factor [Candidatus Obscuribacterales bacterium]|nr:response regulator transcription factor [Candidatus Obscuribacterales bacterium]